MSTPRPQGQLGDELANLGIGILIGGAVVALLLRAAGAVAAWATGTGQPAGGPEAGLAVLIDPGHPSAALQAPGLHPFAYWLTTTLLLGLTVAAAIWVWWMFRVAARTAKVDPHRIPGIATRAEVARAASRSALMKRAVHLRPALANAGPSDVG